MFYEKPNLTLQRMRKLEAFATSEIAVLERTLPQS